MSPDDLAASVSGSKDDLTARVSGSTTRHHGDGDLPAELVDRGVAPLWHPVRWLFTTIVVVFVAAFLRDMWINPIFQWPVFRHWFFEPIIMEGLKLTLQLTALGAVIGLIGGIFLAMMRMSKSPLLQAISFGYTWIFRSIPLIVLLVILANVTAIYPEIQVGIPFGGPKFFEINPNETFSYFAVALIGVSLHESAYTSEIVRAGVLSIDPGQMEAASALGLSKSRQYRRIILPQAVRSIVPNFANLLVMLLKGTSVVYITSMMDLFGSVQMQASINSGQIIPLLMVATVWYIVLTSVLSVIQYYVERYYSKGAVRVMPPTPFQRFKQHLGRFVLMARGGAR